VPAVPSRRRPLRPFRRSVDDSILGGVCAGLAARLGVGTTAVRVAAVVSIFVFGAAQMPLMMKYWQNDGTNELPEPPEPGF